MYRYGALPLPHLGLLLTPGPPLEEIKEMNKRDPPLQPLPCGPANKKRLVSFPSFFPVGFGGNEIPGPINRYRPTSSVLPLCLGGRSAGHGPVQMPEELLYRFEVPYIISPSPTSSSLLCLAPPRSSCPPQTLPVSPRAAGIRIRGGSRFPLRLRMRGRRPS